MLFRFLRLATRLSDVEDRLREVETAQKQIEVEWETTYDNVRRALAKISKRDQRANEEAPPDERGVGAAPALSAIEQMNQRIRDARRKAL